MSNVVLFRPRSGALAPTYNGGVTAHAGSQPAAT